MDTMDYLYRFIFKHSVLSKAIFKWVHQINQGIIDEESKSKFNQTIRHKSVKLHQMTYWTPEKLCTKEFLPLLKWVITMDEKRKDELLFVYGIKFTDLSFSSLPLFMKVNQDYAFHMFIYQKYPRLFELAKKYVNDVVGAANLFDCACSSGSVDIVKHLESIGFKHSKSSRSIFNAVKFNHIELVKYLLTEKKIKIHDGKILEDAIATHSLEMVKIINENLNVVAHNNNNNINNNNNNNNSMYHPKLKKSFFYIFSSAPSSSSSSSPNYVRPTKHWVDSAVINGTYEIVDFLLENRNEGCTELAIKRVLSHGDIKLFKRLMEEYDKGVDSKVKIENPIPYMELVAKCGNLELIKFVYERVKDMPSDNQDHLLISSQVMRMVAVNDSFETLQFLLEQVKPQPKLDDEIIKSSITTRPHALSKFKYLVEKYNMFDAIKNESFMETACMVGNIEIVKYCFDYLESERLLNTFTSNTIEYAVHGNNSDVLELILTRTGAKMKDLTPLSTAVKNNNPKMLEQLLIAFPPQPIQANTVRMGLILVDASAQGLNMVKMLLDNGFQVNNTYECCKSAIYARQLDVFKFFVDEHPTVISQDHFDIAVNIFDLPTVQYILSKVPHFQTTSLNPYKSATEVIEYLISKNKVPHTQMESYISGLCHYNDMETIKLVMENISFGKMQNRVELPFESALKNGKLDVFIMLFNKLSKEDPRLLSLLSIRYLFFTGNIGMAGFKFILHHKLLTKEHAKEVFQIKRSFYKYDPDVIDILNKYFKDTLEFDYTIDEKEFLSQRQF